MSKLTTRAPASTSRLAIEGGDPVRPTPLPLIRVSHGDAERQAVLDVLDRGVFCAVRPEATQVRAFEAAFAAWLGVKHAVAFSSGTTAQHASLAALDLRPGDEVIVPPLTFISTAYTVWLAGATPIFADVDPATFNLDPAAVRQKITPQTRAIVVVHWFGHAVDLDQFLPLAQESGLTLIEDCAHAHGAWYRARRLGTFGRMACWSFQESKILTAAGEGGMLTTDDNALADHARALRDHGKDQTWRGEGYRVTSLGNNYRMTEIQAAFALAQLGRLDELLQARRHHVAYLDQGLAGLPGVVRTEVQPNVTPCYPYYPVRLPVRAFRVPLETFSHALAAEGIGNYAIGREELAHAHPLFASRIGPPHAGYGVGNLPIAEQLARELLLLPLYPDLSLADLDHIIHGVHKVCQHLTI